MVLDSLGLDAAEEALYETLLRHPAASLDELRRHRADFSGPVLAGMVAKGLLRKRDDGYVAVAPDLALRMLLDKRRRTLEVAEQRIAELDRLHRAQPGPPAEPPVELVPGPAAHDRLTALHRLAADQIRSFETPPYAKKLLPADSQLAMEGLGRGMRHRIVYSRAAVEDQGLATLTACLGAGEEARVVGEVPMRLSLFDDQAAILPVTAGRMITEGILVVRPSSLLDALSTLFEIVWARALPLGLDQPTEPADGVDDESVLVALLAAGMSDHAIARQLDISVRTVGRKIQRVLADLNAATRFQAGVAVGMARTNGDR